MSSTYIPQLDAAHFDRLNAALRPQQGTGYEYVRPKAGIPYPYERSENLLSAPACFDRLNTPLQAAWTYHATNMPCAAFTPQLAHAGGFEKYVARRGHEIAYGINACALLNPLRHVFERHGKPAEKHEKYQAEPSEIQCPVGSARNRRHQDAETDRREHIHECADEYRRVIPPERYAEPEFCKHKHGAQFHKPYQHFLTAARINRNGYGRGG